MPSLFDVRIETERLILRCVEETDADAISALMTSDISRWLASWKIPYTREMALKRIEDSRQKALDGEALPLAVVEKRTGDFIGWVSLYRYAANPDRGVVGYWLGQPFQGKGYFREIGAAFLQTGFRLFELAVIEAGAQLENEASFGVMRSWGMREGETRTDYSSARDREELCRYFKITREDFEI
ncbi:GNAT family N-acetyltransferase [Thalassospira alkalitolerans]|uniref:GNAT family N-acetyltransferase n=1 Tax=Thalassospira alkalitolerans TaxID=1293890 RepID=UPI0030EF9F51|tara:strand:- start:790 stop:1341 length:552 start_codon:yes stop_codon:yes gene_type:complete